MRRVAGVVEDVWVNVGVYTCTHVWSSLVHACLDKECACVCMGACLSRQRGMCCMHIRACEYVCEKQTAHDRHFMSCMSCQITLQTARESGCCSAFSHVTVPESLQHPAPRPSLMHAVACAIMLITLGTQHGSCCCNPLSLTPFASPARLTCHPCFLLPNNTHTHTCTHQHTCMH